MRGGNVDVVGAGDVAGDAAETPLAHPVWGDLDVAVCALAAQGDHQNIAGVGLDVVEVALERKLPLKQVAKVYFNLGEALHLKWLMQKIDELPVEGRWHAHARGVSRDELFAQQRALSAQVLERGDGKADGGALVDAWIKRDDTPLKFTLAMFADMRSQVNMDYPTVSVAVRRLAQLVQAGSRG